MQRSTGLLDSLLTLGTFEPSDMVLPAIMKSLLLLHQEELIKESRVNLVSVKR